MNEDKQGHNTTIFTCRKASPNRSVEKPRDLCPPKLFNNQQGMSTRESTNNKYDDTTAQEV